MPAFLVIIDRIMISWVPRGRSTLTSGRPPPMLGSFTAGAARAFQYSNPSCEMGGFIGVLPSLRLRRKGVIYYTYETRMRTCARLDRRDDTRAR
jgi:hypothetical protein